MKHYLNSEILSKKRMDILTLLYKYRSGTAKQILSLLEPQKFPFDYVQEMNPTSFNKQTAVKNLQKYLSDLKKQALIQSEYVALKTGNTQVYSLTREGLNYIKGHLYIEFEYQGSGFGADYGDFTYELYKPPLKRNIHHHLLTVDFFTIVEQFVDHHSIMPGTIQYRDNRYCSVEYKVKSKTYKHRPDAELMIDNKLYWIEIDRSTESSSIMVNKFDNYSRYLQHLLQNGFSLPEGIIFLTDNKRDKVGKDRRWKTITKAFNEELNKYGHLINLIYGSLSELANIITQEFVAEEMIEKRLKSYVKYYLTDQSFIELDESTGLESRYALCTITHYDSHDLLFLYERVNCYETRGPSRLATFLKFLKSHKQIPDKLKRVREVIPVFYQHLDTAKPLPVDFGILSLPNDSHIHLQDPIWINIFGDSPIWMHANGTPINESNPLRAIKPEISFTR